MLYLGYCISMLHESARIEEEMMIEEDLVAVMVPKRHLTAVYGLIANLAGNNRPGFDSAPPKNPSDNGARVSDDWTRSLIRRAVQQSPPAMKDILRVFAD